MDVAVAKTKTKGERLNGQAGLGLGKAKGTRGQLAGPGPGRGKIGKTGGTIIAPPVSDTPTIAQTGIDKKRLQRACSFKCRREVSIALATHAATLHVWKLSDVEHGRGLAGAIGEVLVHALRGKRLCGSITDPHNFCTAPLRVSLRALRQRPRFSRLARQDAPQGHARASGQATWF